MIPNLPQFEGWHLIGRYPEGDPDGVGSWLLHHDREAMLLEVPECLDLDDVRKAVDRLGVVVRSVTASHEHWDHLDEEAWSGLTKMFPEAEMIHPTKVRGHRRFDIGGEPVWLVKAPKHSACDVVTIFRGVAMTGDIELGKLDSGCGEVPIPKRRESMRRLLEFPVNKNYQVHSVISAHLNDVRLGVNWPSLFEV
jgi:hydroxyacylglutathione hydrolase